MKLRFATIALSATLVACGGSSGDSPGDNSGDNGDDNEEVFIGGGTDFEEDDNDDFDEDDDLDENGFVDGEDLSGLDADGNSLDGCEGGSGTDRDSSTPEWDDNCRLQVGGEHATSSYTQGMQRIVFCRGHDGGRPVDEINSFADGIFGPLTEEQVRNFQEAEGIATDGVVGPETWGALRDVLEFLSSATEDGSDAYGVLPGTCAGVVQFYQDRIDNVGGGWTMARTPGNPSDVPFSVGPPN